MKDEKDVSCPSFFGNIIERKFLCKNLYCQVVDGRLVADGELQQPLILPAISVEIFVDDIANKDARRIDYRIYSKDIVNDNNISSLVEEIRKNGGRFSEEIDKKYKFIKAFDGENKKVERIADWGVLSLSDEKAKFKDYGMKIMADLIKDVGEMVEKEDEKIKLLKDFVINIEKHYNKRVKSLEKNVCSLKEKISFLPNGQIFPNNNNNDVISYLIKRIAELENKMSNPYMFPTTISEVKDTTIS